MVFLTGDIHGNPYQLVEFCNQHNLTKDDIIVIMGDAGFNFFLSDRDKRIKNKIKKVKPTFLCIHGNHEARPTQISTYKSQIWHNGAVFYEEEYPNLLFAKDGEIYDLEGKKCMAIGGAYSVDKYFRIINYILKNNIPIEQEFFNKALSLVNGDLIDDDKKIQNALTKFAIKELPYGKTSWFEDEQPDENIKNHIEENLEKNNYQIDIIFSHTCPSKYIPIEMFLSGINQSSVDNSTEDWLNEIEEKTSYQKWYCGHWHTNKSIDKIEFLFHTIKTL